MDAKNFTNTEVVVYFVTWFSKNYPREHVLSWKKIILLPLHLMLHDFLSRYGFYQKSIHPTLKINKSSRLKNWLRYYVRFFSNLRHHRIPTIQLYCSYNTVCFWGD